MSPMKKHTHMATFEKQEHTGLPLQLPPRMACVLVGRHSGLLALWGQDTQLLCDWLSVLRISPGSTAPVSSLSHVG